MGMAGQIIDKSITNNCLGFLKTSSRVMYGRHCKIIDFSGLGGIAMIVQWVPTRKMIHHEVGDFLLYSKKRIRHHLLRVVIGGYKRFKIPILCVFLIRQYQTIH